MEAAGRLTELGRFDWAEREWRFVIEESPQDSGLAIYAGAMMASTLQDQQQYLKAAQARQTIVERFDANPGLRDRFQDVGGAFDEYLSPRRIRAAMDYCFAMHYAAAGDRAKQVEHLDKAVRADPRDGDVLIALFRLPEQTEEQQAVTKRRIERAARAIQIDIERYELTAKEDVSEQPLLARRQNEYAWLVSNTFGDFDRALEYSIKCNDHYDNASGGLLDTLARCHYAKGDLASAIRVQTRALQLDPHSSAIARQLAFFREQAAKNDAANRGAATAAQAPRATEPD
jgi:tetratricopeptide (TPR) repeat protein